MKEPVKFGVVLGVICIISSALLAVVNGFTQPQIKLQNEKEEKAALEAVFPQAANFKAHISADKLDYYLVYDGSGHLQGFAIKASGKGYSSDIETLVGLNLDLDISAIKVLSLNETPGLGSRVAEKDFTGQFQGKNSSSISSVQAITGATISSRAVINSIKDKISELMPELSKEIKDAR